MKNAKITTKWYKDAVMGAARAGIISGVDAGHFMPEKKIT
ncbi:MAG: S-layer homology domain-containing protein [Tepidanaerobacteraceae bacterium]|jgi:hypothetical protein|nr:S-layer homology domain-containing protein [Tepidanaerobacteraceae bacterium]